MRTDKAEGIDWEKYLSQFDLIYETPSKIWQDGFAIGNGSLGAMVYEPFHLEWTVNKNNVWDYRKPEVKRHSIEYVREIAMKNKNYAEEMRKEDIYGGNLYPAPKTCGQLRIRFGYDSIYAPPHKVRKRLDLHEGTIYTSLDKHLSHPRVTSFVCAEEDLLVIRVRDVSAMTAFHNNVDIYHIPDALLPTCRKGAEKDILWIEQPFHDGFRYVMMAKIVPAGTCAYSGLFKKTVQKKWWYAIEPSEKVESRIDGEYAVAPVAGDFDVYVTVVTMLDAKNPMATARRRLDDAASRGAGRLHREHRKWWSGFWEKSYVGMDDPFLEQMWYVSLYNLATVLPGTPVGGLCGLWYGPMETPSQILPWKGMYTNDYNAQAPVAPVFRANHPELADGSFRTLLAQLVEAKNSARQLYKMPGAYYPVSSDPTGREVTNGAYRFCQNSGPEWCVFLWWHYLYTKDKEYLRQVSYPIMREVAMFFVNYMRWHGDEKLYHLEVSQNPELMYIKYPDPVYTLTLLKYTLKGVIEAAAILKTDKKLVTKCRHVLEHYPPYPMDGKEILPLKDLRSNHINHCRTISGLFPCGEFDPEIAPEWTESCAAEIRKGDTFLCTYGCNKGRINTWTGGYYFVGAPACWMGMKETAWRYLEYLLKSNLKPNGLVTHNGVTLADSRLSEENIKNIPDAEIYHDLDHEPLKMVEILTGRLSESTTENLEYKETIFPALEGPAMYLLMVGEMLLQSHNGILRVFPGLPDKRDAQFIDLRAQGPVLVSSRRKKGQVEFVALRALAPVQITLKSPWTGAKIWRSSGRDGRKVSVHKNERHIDITLQAGEKTVLAPVRKNLSWPALVAPRSGEKSEARSITLSDGMTAWLGKPVQDRYYKILRIARTGKKDS